MQGGVSGSVVCATFPQRWLCAIQLSSVLFPQLVILTCLLPCEA